MICEFNPFHNGHKFLLEKIKTEYADQVICVMSGSFVQRGDIAITDKYSRARAALENGADAVVELPSAYAVSSAEIFSENGVRIAAAMGCDMLCFGAESGIGELKALSDMLGREDINQKIRGYLDNGEYYPKALSLAVGDEYADIISQPNNILALEYIKACKKYGIEPVAIQRMGSAHDSAEICGSFASATVIRGLITSGEAYSEYTPMIIDKPSTLSAVEPAILYRLKTMTTDRLALIAEVGEGLENRISDSAQKYNSLEEILNAVKTKRYTMARLRRIVIQSLLGITSRIQNTPVPYLRVLGIKSGCDDMLKNAGLPLIIKTKADYEKLDDSAREIFNIDINASHAMNIALKGAVINEFTQPLLKV